MYNDGTISPVVTYCDIQGTPVWPGTGNINLQPLFVRNPDPGPDEVWGTPDDDYGDLHLTVGSPCIDAGDNTAVPGGVTTDLDGEPRFVDDPATGDTGYGTPPIVDMGAYEYRVIIYVDGTATGANNGASWQDAYNYLQDALADAAVNADDIWVAAGTYKPDEDTDNSEGTNRRTDAFALINGVGIYGGFPSGGGDWQSRNPDSYETILSGDIGIADANDDNSYQVVTASGADATAILDGFTITVGNANGTDPDDRGAGMYNNSASPTVTDCTFAGNSAFTGGGIFNDGNASPAVTDCTFSNNSATAGGGMCNDADASPAVADCTFSSNSAFVGGGLCNAGNGSPTVTNCTFIGNRATHDGGGMSGLGSPEPNVANCTFSANEADNKGGGVYNPVNAKLNLTNCTFNANEAGSDGGGVYNSNSDTTVTNCTFSGNTSSLIGGGMCNGGSASPTVTNCTFSGNTADYGGGLGDWNGNPMVRNCILWGNDCDVGAPDEAQIYTLTGTLDVNYCCIQDWAGGGAGNISVDPLFVRDPDPGLDGEWGTGDDDYGDLRLAAGSPCIDAGDNTAVPGDVTTDLDGGPRFADDPATIDTGYGTPPIVDMGAYEYPIDTDGDGVPDYRDNCPLTSNAGQEDGDMDGMGDACDNDDDNDGVPDAEDSDPLNPYLCRDMDADTCDDCSSGTDDPANDGLDTDSDGLCDAGDADDDGDGVSDAEDSDPLDPYVCRDMDADTCDDCSSGTDDPANDGLDTDSDGLCDAGDADDDGDGVPDVEDSDPLDPYLCRDMDADTCDDCSSGTDDPANDGLDTDSDGLCDAGDADDDGDGVADAEDSDPLNPYVCRDMDSDTCDDCSSGTDDPANDGLDTDTDGICDLGDNCPSQSNPTQEDTDTDGVGNACDCDADGLCTAEQYCQGQGTADPDCGPADSDGDGVPDGVDNCPYVQNPDQTDVRPAGGDGIGDACQNDFDGDGENDNTDNCPATYNPDQLDGDGDLRGNACDLCPADPSDACAGGATEIGPAGGTVANAAGTVSIDIPAGALTEPTTISIIGQTDISDYAIGRSPGNMEIGYIYTFQPAGLTFADSVTITLTYEQGTMPECKGVENNLDIYHYDDVLGWVAQGATGECASNTLTLDIDHFSTYVVVAIRDSDSDEVLDPNDNCPFTYNPSQTDSDGDEIGNACDGDCPNLDGLNPVDFIDFSILGADWEVADSNLPGDLNLSGAIDINDLEIFGLYWLTDCYEEQDL